MGDNVIHQQREITVAPFLLLFHAMWETVLWDYLTQGARKQEISSTSLIIFIIFIIFLFLHNLQYALCTLIEPSSFPGRDECVHPL